MGLRTDGVRTIDDLMDRCRTDEVEGCWVWAGGNDGGGRPSLWLPALERRVTIGTAICVLRTGKPPAAGVVWHCTCTTPNCANPQHRKAGTRSSQMLAANLHCGPLTRARIAAAKRANSALSDAGAEDVRGSSEPLHIVADRYGISVAHASRIRRGEMRLPLSARGASVFNLGS